jgi:hypothetical protein
MRLHTFSPPPELLSRHYRFKGYWVSFCDMRSRFRMSQMPISPVEFARLFSWFDDMTVFRQRIDTYREVELSIIYTAVICTISHAAKSTATKYSPLHSASHRQLYAYARTLTGMLFTLFRLFSRHFKRIALLAIRRMMASISPGQYSCYSLP